MPEGLKFVLPFSFTDTSLPKLRPDALINDGSLFLIDFGREETAPRASVPANGSALANLAWQSAAAVIGSGNESTLAGTFENSLSGLPLEGLVERSSRYGIHVISSQVAQTAGNRHGGVSVPNTIISHVLANLPGHAFYVSVWGRLTRVATSAPDSIGYLGDVSNSTRFAWRFDTQPTQAPNSGSAFVGSYSDPNSNVAGYFHRAVAVDEFTGTEPLIGSATAKFWFGKQGVYSGFQTNIAASGILYRIYIEDLTASGRSWAETLAADQALYAAAIGSGGRFNGDTFTNPSTLP